VGAGGSRGSGGWLVLIAGCATIWGSIPLVIRQVDPVPIDVAFLSAPYDAAPVLIVFWRVLIASCAMVLYLASRRRLPEITAVGRPTLLALALNGALLAVHWFLFFSALLLTDVAVAELLTFTGPIYVAALTPLVLRERFDPRVLVPISLALLGMALVLGPDLASLEGPSALAAAVVFAFLILNAKRLLRGVSSAVVMFWESAVATALLLPLALLLPGFTAPDDWLAVFTLGSIHSGIVAFAFLTALRHVRADHAAVLMYVEPVAAVLLAALFLNEPLTPLTLVGGAGVVAGGALVARMARTPGAEGPFADIEGASAG
jgi:drug/metabolite transporter (DMT)-like permease